MIAGLEEITDGKMYIGEKIVNDLPPKDRDIAMVFQSYALYPHMTVRENIEFGLRIRKVPQEQINKLVDEAATILDIKQLLDRKPKQLSGGQRQRVALGRAIVRKPAVFLFDEPLSNLDAKLRVQMRAEITKLQQRLKTTAVYVTHDQVEAMTMGNRIAVMNAGKLQQVGTPLDLYELPANVFVAQFIGTPPMNLIKGVIGDGGTTIATPKYSIPVSKSLQSLTQGKDGKKVVFGVRPENIVSANRSARGEIHRITVEVEIVEPLGHEVVIYGRLGDDLIVAKLDPHEIPKMGETCDLLIELDELHLFDADTELRMAAGG
jgi:multiple sugar transport system ATP-binding protein